MIEFGIALVIGGLAFATCVIPSIAYLINFGFMKKRPTINEYHKSILKRFRLCFIRDILLTLISLTTYYFSLSDGILDIVEISL